MNNAEKIQEAKRLLAEAANDMAGSVSGYHQLPVEQRNIVATLVIIDGHLIRVLKYLGHTFPENSNVNREGE